MINLWIQRGYSVAYLQTNELICQPWLTWVRKKLTKKDAVGLINQSLVIQIIYIYIYASRLEFVLEILNHVLQKQPDLKTP